MKRTPFVITLLIVVVSVGGFFAYDWFFAKKQTDLWSLVPQSSVVVYESSNCTTCIESARQSPLWQLVSRAALFERKQDSLQSLVAFLSNPKPGSLASLHVTKKDGFDFVFYLPLYAKSEKLILEAAVEEWKKKPGFKYSEREFNGFKIQELTGQGNVFSWVMLDDAWAGSFTPFLVEDVVRTVNADNESNFRETIASVYQMPRIKGDAGNLYLSVKNLSQWLSVFDDHINQDVFASLGESTLLDVKNGTKNLVLNGFTANNMANPQSLLTVFRAQTPVPFESKSYVSNRTAVYTMFGINDGKALGKALQSYSLSKRKQFTDTLARVAAALKVDINAMYRHIDDEVGVCYVESGSNQISKVLLIESEKSDSIILALNKIATQLSEDTVFHEPFSSYELRELPLYRFPEKLLWPLVSGFDHTYYATNGKVVFMAEDLEGLKQFLDDVDKEETWGRSVLQNKFLSSTLLESNLSLFVNSGRVWHLLSNNLQPRWQRFLAENGRLTHSLGMGAIQFSNLNESFYTNAIWTYDQPAAASSPAGDFQRTVTNFDSGVLSRPYVVRSHVDRSYEVVVQDSAYNVYLVSSQGKALWKYPSNGPIIGKVEQVDFFNNGKLQYFFATPGQLHIVDRLGNTVSPFPIATKTKDIEYISVIDYDHSKKYRFLVAERSGKLWMFDKDGKNLDGWNPRNIEGELFTAPEHQRIRGRDYLIAMRKDGTMYIMNRRGENLKGFPLKLDARPTGDYFLEVGSGSSNSYIVVVSRDGFRIKFDLEGKVQSRETLVKASIESTFSLIRENTGKSYIIVRQDPKGLTLYSPDNKEIVINEYIGKNAVDIQVFDFGAGDMVYTVTDRVQDLSFLYDKNGSFIIPTPLESQGVAVSKNDQDRVKTYTTYQNTLIVQAQ